jgi:hypothetical protein
MHFDLELRLDPVLATPAHHLVLGPVQPFLDKLSEGFFLLGVSPTSPIGEGGRDKGFEIVGRESEGRHYRR